MLKLSLAAALAAALLAVPLFADEPSTRPAAAPSSPLDFTMKSLAGKEVPLSQYRGKVVLIVNTASQCGNTPQYAPLESMYEKYKDQGLVVLGFPANNFGQQEPGTNDQIGEFCKANFGVTFPMFSKISVKGEDEHPLYKLLTSFQSGAVKPGDIHWNFEKFLLNREGRIVARFDPKTQPDSPEVLAAVEAELKKPS